MSIDQQFVEFVIKSLVSKPDEVKVERRIDEKGVLLELTVDPEDLGRVIGKRGATAQSIRTLLRALGTKNDARYNLKIVDNGFPQEERREARKSEEQADTQPRKEEPTEEKPVEKEAKEEVSEPEDDPWASSPKESQEKTAPESEENDVLAKTRKELADLDDLDV